MDRQFRALLLSVLLLAVAAPSAHAGFADKLIPTVDASHGVTASASTRAVRVTFGAKAAKRYRTLAGRNARLGCGDPSIRSSGDMSHESGSDTPSVTRSGGLWWVDRKLPASRGAVRFHRAGSADLCFITTRQRSSDDGCMPFFSDCVRMLIALNDTGRARLDEFARAIELDLAFTTPFEQLRKDAGANALVALPAPDAAPGPGQVGVFDDGTTRTVAALLASGQRLYVSRSAGVFTTNVPALSTPFAIRGLI